MVNEGRPVEDEVFPESGDEGENELIFPCSALRGTFADIVELLRPVTGASTAHVFAATWAALATCIARARWGSWSGRVVTPVYALCVGPTGDYKSSAMDQVADLLPASIRRVDGVATDAGLFDALEAASGASVLLHFDELSFLLKTAAMSGQTLDAMLNRLWSAPARFDRNLSKRNRDCGARSIENPRVSLVAGSHVETFWGYLQDPDLAIASGFVNRLATFCVERSRSLAITRRPDEAGSEQIRAHLGALTELEHQEVPLSGEGERLWREYSEEHDRRIAVLERIDAAVMKRTRDHVARLALVYATDAGRLVIEPEDLLLAIEVGAFISASYRHLLAGRPLAHGGPDREGGIEETCRRLLGKRPAIGQSVRDLQQSWPSRPKPPARQIQNVLEGMRAADLVESSSRGQRIVYRLVREHGQPPPHTEPGEKKEPERGVWDDRPRTGASTGSACR
jgi:hypothetical protein